MSRAGNDGAGAAGTEEWRKMSRDGDDAERSDEEERRQ
jgi:hypothetical protein